MAMTQETVLAGTGQGKQSDVFMEIFREQLDKFLEDNPDLTEDQAANPEYMVGVGLGEMNYFVNLQEVVKRPFYCEFSCSKLPAQEEDTIIKPQG